ncbi:hypothetical protein BaRGS_00038115 [Batillaria attramentaria]|uniref:Uncharacterized protein n=1 Tax=Batillaria attramentaria TaxID=370345 RepID=A0ABD0J7T4_9CAEN
MHMYAWENKRTAQKTQNLTPEGDCFVRRKGLLKRLPGIYAARHCFSGPSTGRLLSRDQAGNLSRLAEFSVFAGSRESSETAMLEEQLLEISCLLQPILVGQCMPSDSLIRYMQPSRYITAKSEPITVDNYSGIFLYQGATTHWETKKNGCTPRVPSVF